MIATVSDPDVAALNTDNEDVVAMALALVDLEEQYEALSKKSERQATNIGALYRQRRAVEKQLEVSQSALRELMIRARNLRDYDSDRAEHLLDLALEGAASALGRDSDLSGAFGAGNEPVADAASNPASEPKEIA